MTETLTAPTEDDAEIQVEDYWGTDETKRHYLPDKKQYFTIQVMNEGQKSKYQTQARMDITMKRSGDTNVKMDPAKERHELIKASVTGWHFYKKVNGVAQIVDFSTRILETWLETAPVKVVEDLEFAIRMANPWLQGDMSLEDIDKEIERLQELRQQVKEREAGELVSANK